MTLATIIKPGRPTSSRRVAPSLHAFLELAFRPLYLAGTAWATIAIGIWIYAPEILTAPLQGIAWHAHEMLWGFIATIAVGFLMTAGANWTGINPMHGGALAIACVLWLLARVGFLVNGDTWFWIATAAELAFFLLAAIAMMRAVYRARNTRNYAVPWLLVALGAADVLYLLAARSGDYALLMQRFNAGLLVMAMIALLVARRVIPFFAMRAIPGLSLPMQTRVGQVQLAACATAVVFVLAGLAMPAAIAVGLRGSARAAAGGSMEANGSAPESTAMDSLCRLCRSRIGPARDRMHRCWPAQCAACAARTRDRDGRFFRVDHRHGDPHGARPPGAPARRRSQHSSRAMCWCWWP